MKKLALIVVVAMAILVSVSVVFAGVQSFSSPSISKKIETEQSDYWKLHMCESVFEKYKALIDLAIESSDDVTLTLISREFINLSNENEDGSLDTCDQYFLYVATNLTAMVAGIKGEIVPAEITAIFSTITIDLVKKLELCEMELPLPIPPANLFEEPDCCKASREIEIFYNQHGSRLDSVTMSQDPEAMINFMAELMGYANDESRSKIARLYFSCMSAKIGMIVNTIMPGLIEKEKLNLISQTADKVMTGIINDLEKCNCLSR